MNKLKATFISLGACFLLASCGSNDSKKTENNNDSIPPQKENTGPGNNSSAAGRLDGAWEIKRAEGDMAELNVGTVYEFKGNRLSFGKEGFLNPGSTEITDNTFSFQADGNELKFMYDYHFNGDTLVVTMQNGVGQVFHLVKK